MSAIQELIEAVEGGREINVGDIGAVGSVFPDNEFVFFNATGRGDFALGYAHALIEDTLPEWLLDCGTEDIHDRTFFGRVESPQGLEVIGYANCPGRALVLAILKALATTTEGEG